ncbi:MAG: hypothetical protein JXN61_02470 [Sedimentisphaerales bacterium]|nr:hypothetical protein [Sedimentisphaerales bacterium]
MLTIDVAKWRVSFDPDATSKLYTLASAGYANSCDCDFCLNFVAQRDSVYPPTVREVLQQIGVDYRKETEISYVTTLAPDCHLYLGHFVFVGSVECLAESSDRSRQVSGLLEQVEVTEFFSWSFKDCKSGTFYKTPDGKPRSELVFQTKLPWVLDLPEPA